MTLLPPIATSDAPSNFNVLIGVIAAIGWVVMQIMGKAAKNKPPPTNRTPSGSKPETPEDAAPVSDAAEEMRRFFQRLEGAYTPESVPPKVPAAAPATGPERGRRTTAASQSVTASGQAVTSASQRTAARRNSEQQASADVSRTASEAYPKLAVAMHDVPVTAGAFAEAHAHEGRLAFVRRLRSTSDLRQAVAMMEVLSPPLGMRRTPFPIG